jgi:hypothetical protein
MQRIVAHPQCYLSFGDLFQPLSHSAPNPDSFLTRIVGYQIKYPEHCPLHPGPGILEWQMTCEIIGIRLWCSLEEVT